MEFPSNSRKKNWSKKSSTHRPSTDTFHFLSTDSGVIKTSLNDKYKALKHENAKLVSILYSKDSQSKLLESQLRNLEKEFLKYKTSCENVINAFKPSSPDQSLIEQANGVMQLANDSPRASNSFKKANGHKMKNYIHNNQLGKALKISLKLNKELLSQTDRKSNSKLEIDDSLIRESEHLLRSINKQSSKISKIIQSSESSTPKNSKNK